MLWSAARKLGKTAGMSAAGTVGDSPLFAADYLLRALRVVALLSVWRMLLGDRGAVSGLTLPAALTYTLIAEIFAEPLACRTEVDYALWNGSITTRYLRPLGLVGQFAAEAFGRWAFGFCAFSLPLLIVSPWLGVNPLPASPAAGALFVVSLALAIAVGLALEFIAAALMVAWDLSLWDLLRMREAIAALLSGAFIPLALFPWGLGAVIGWLPFASMASAPLRIYTGTGSPAALLALQAAWAVALSPVAALLWRVNRERMVSYGG